MPKLLSLETPWAAIEGEAWFGHSAPQRPLIVALHGGGFTRAYFKAGASLPAAAGAAGFDVVLLDRPCAGRSRFHRRQDDILTDNAQALSAAIESLWREVGGAYSGVFVVGHSIGGAIALILASGSPTWPLAGVAVSGIGDRPPEGLTLDGVGDLPIVLPRPAMAALFLAPDAVSDDALDRMQSAATAATPEEIRAIYRVWPAIVGATLPAIAVPAQLILAEHETLWQTGDAVIDRLDAALLQAARKEVAVWPEVGHCIDYHPAASAFLDRIFAFIPTG